MGTKQVHIPHDYFLKMAIRDYYSWRSAIFREFIQNSVDAGARTIEFEYDGEYLTVRDNGSGMDMETIEKALLTLGGTKKDGDSVGGIGKAKEILYFSWPDWMISSRGVKVTGSGPSYSTGQTKDRPGVVSRIRIEKNIQEPINYLREYLASSSLGRRGVKVYYNRERITGSGIEYGDKIYRIEGLGDLFKVQASGQGGSRIIVQSRGLFMFSNYSVLDKSYLFNITQPSYDCLTSNRDSFVSDWQDQFSKMVGKVAIDSESTNLKKETVIQVQALNRPGTADPVQEVIRSVGTKGFRKLQELAEANGKDLTGLKAQEILDLLDGDYLMTESIIDKGTQKKIRTVVSSPKAVNKTKLLDNCLAWYKKAFPEGFVIVSTEDITTGLARHMYDTETLKLAWLWKETVDEIAGKAGIKQDYGYGIIMDVEEQTLAQSRDGFLLINPFPYYDMGWEEAALDMILTASEELTHHLGYPVHNETFKNKYTGILKLALEDRTKIKSLLKTTRKVTKKHGVKHQRPS